MTGGIGRALAWAGVVLAACLTPPAPAQERSGFEARLAAAASGGGAAACGRLEQLLAVAPDHGGRSACYLHLAELTPAAVPPLTPVEKRELDELRARSLPIAETLVGRYVIVLATRGFADGARRSKLVRSLDLAYIALRRLFAVDPVRRVGHRYLFFPDPSNRGPHHINPGLRVSIPRGAADDASPIDVFIHEISHGFGYFHPARHLFAAAFFEGWADLAPAFVSDELEALGPPFADRLADFAHHFESVGRAQYLDTRLPIEEIVNYDPASSLLMRLAGARGSSGRAVDWEPLVRLLERTAKSPPRRLPDYMWPVAMGEDLREAFGADVATPILREYRFPLDEWNLDLLRRHRSPKRPRDLHGAPVTKWEVLGPIPDPQESRLDLDPIDPANGIDGRAEKIGGTSHAWRRDVPVDERGRVLLSTLPSSEVSCVFYLRGTIAPAAAGPHALFVASDDDVALWVDGVLVHEFRGNRGTDPSNPDRVFVSLPNRPVRVVAQVANHGGPAGFSLAVSPESPYRGAYRRALESDGAARRRAMVEFLGSRRVTDDQIVPLVRSALRDADPGVRRAAALALAGRRNHRAVLPALLAGWGRERDGAVRRTIRRAVEETCLRDFEDEKSLRAWWSRNRSTVAGSYFAECEQAIAAGSFRGGYYGWNGGCYGGQCVARDWGGTSDHRLGLRLESRSRRALELALRYTCADRGARLSLTLRRGARIVWRAKSVELPPTSSWSTWSWLELEVGRLGPGRYRLEIHDPKGSPDLDVVGLRVR